MALDPHALAEARSLAAHRLIADRLRNEPELLERARARVQQWLREGGRPYAQAWAQLLALELPELVEALVDPSQRGRDLRQCTPFAGAIDPRTRWRLWAQVREELEGG